MVLNNNNKIRVEFQKMLLNNTLIISKLIKKKT